jgi:hypothetical protein
VQSSTVEIPSKRGSQYHEQTLTETATLGVLLMHRQPPAIMSASASNISGQEHSGKSWIWKAIFNRSATTENRLKHDRFSRKVCRREGHDLAKHPLPPRFLGCGHLCVRCGQHEGMPFEKAEQAFFLPALLLALLP